MVQIRTFVLSVAVTGALLLSACSPSAPDTAAGRASASSPAADAAAATPARAEADSLTLVVYKTASCPCCREWVTYMQKHGFRTVTYDVSDLDAVKQKHGIPGHLQSCHTTEVGGYFVEGHVPADLVRRLLAERPRIAGLAVPGMPVGSPGMEVGPPEPYEILSVDSAGRTAVFARR